MIIYLLLFISFAQVGFLGIGGSFAAQALIEHETITLHHWITADQLADLMVFCRTLPGGTGLNSAALVGALATVARYGFWGSVMASIISALGLSIPAALWSGLLTKIKNNKNRQGLMECVMTLLRPLVPGLIAAAAIIMMNKDNFGDPTTNPWQFGVTTFLFFATLIGTTLYHFKAIFMILICGFAGWILL